MQARNINNAKISTSKWGEKWDFHSLGLSPNNIQMNYQSKKLRVENLSTHCPK